MMALLGFSGALFTVDATQAQTKTPWQFNQAETELFFKGAASIQTQGWGPTNAKVQTVVKQLVAYSGDSWKVVPGQTFQWGQAHVGGWIILDISSASASDDILAFRLSHEWGHESLGHTSTYNQMMAAWKFKMNPTGDEDAADVYAARFMATYNYDIEDAHDQLRSMPPSPPWDTHSTGIVRARRVRKAYFDKIITLGKKSIMLTATCKHLCGNECDDCDGLVKARAQACLDAIKTDPAYIACSCPNWPYGNLNCYEVCKAGFNAAKNVCEPRMKADFDACTAELATCKASCPAKPAPGSSSTEDGEG